MQLIPDWIDRRPEGRKIFADLDQERRRVSETCVLASYESRIKREAKLAEFVLLNQYFLLRTFF